MDGIMSVVVAQFERPGFDHRMGEWLFFRGFLMLLVLGAVATAAVLIWRRRDDDPLRRAARRYAAGRIERVEFERIQADLLASGSGRVPDALSETAAGAVPDDPRPVEASDD